MAKHVIREVTVTPALPRHLVVLDRAEIQCFIETAHRTVAQLEAEVRELRERQRVERVERVERPQPVEDVEDDWGSYRRRLVGLPEWADPVDAAPDNVAFFESLRDDDASTLIAGFDPEADDDGSPAPRWVYRPVDHDHPAVRHRA